MYKKILVPVDGSESSLRGLDEAIKLARELGATLRLIYAVNEFFVDVDYGASINVQTVIDALREDGEEILRSAASKVRERNLTVETALLDQIGVRVSDLILEQAKKWQADLIVMGTHGRRGLTRLVMGSDAEMVLRSSTVPVLLVRATNEK